MHVTKAKLAANRANAQHSTGPRSAEGRQRASLNAIKHGCTSQTIILPGEDSKHFAAFHASFQASFQPANALEESLVESLAHTQWVINRVRAHENNLFALGHLTHSPTIATDDTEIQTALAGAKTLRSEIDVLKTSSLYLQRNARYYQATLKQLLELQTTRRRAVEKKELFDSLGMAKQFAGAPLGSFVREALATAAAASKSARSSPQEAA